MKYKILFIMSILFIVSISAVSAENVDNQTTMGEIDASIDMENDIISSNVLAANEKGTFKELETILWRASDGDTITLDKDYYYDGADRKVMGVYRQITLDGAGHTLDGNKGARIFYVGSDAKSLTLKNINFINANIDGSGGAILNDGAKLTITDCNFTNNRITGTTGGAIASNNANVVITNCKFSGNYATGVGGAVSITGNNAKITNCIFTNNEARDHLGGAVLIYGNYATVQKNTFTNNKAGRDGGAIDIEGKTESYKCTGVTIIDNTFTGNSAPFGGAVGLNGDDATISNNIFKSNKATDSKTQSFAGIGGAMRLIGNKNIKLIGNTFTDNTAYRQGGAFYLEGANSIISKNTFTNNHATNDAGGSMNLNGNGISISENTIKTSSSKTSGGAIFITGDNVKITDNEISQAKSTGSYGGAIRIKGDSATISGNEITNCNSKENGGAIRAEGKNTQLKNNIITKCSGENGGGAYLVGSGSVAGCSFISCSASGYGGGIYFKNREYTLGGNTFSGDSAGKGGSNYYPTDIPSGKMPTTLTAKYDSNAQNIVASVKDATGKAVSGVKVGFAVDGVKYVVSDANGQAKYSTKGLAEKKYDITVRAFGNGEYEDSNKVTVTVDLSKISTTITAPDVTTRYNGGKHLVATLKDVNGKVITGAKVKVVLGNSTRILTTDANGQVSVSTDGLDYNTYTATITFDGDAIYKKSSTTAKVYVTDKEQSKIFLRNALYFVLQTKMVKVTLWDSNNKPLVNKTVYIKVYDSRYHGVTDENGTASIRVGVGFGVHEATVSFDGDDQYTPASRTGSIRVIKETPSLMLPGAYTKFKASDKTKIVKIFLKDRYDKPLLQGTKVFLKINGQTYAGSIDINGIANINLNINNVGTYTAELIYTGNTAYNAVRKNTKIFII